MLRTSAFALIALVAAASAQAVAPAKPRAAAPNPVETQMRVMDTDRSGFISEDEFLKVPRNIFAKLDANKDGKVTPAEIQADFKAQEKRRAELVAKVAEMNKAAALASRPAPPTGAAAARHKP